MIFFDLDNTLLDHTTASCTGALLFREQHTALQSIEEETFLKIWHDITQQSHDLWIEGQMSLDASRIWRMKEVFKGIEELSDDESLKRVSRSIEFYNQSWCLFPDTINALERLKGEAVGVITNGHSEQQRNKLDRFDLLKYFDVVIISAEVGHSKPSKEIFEEAARQSNRPIHECFYIGDSLKKDAEGSIAAGMKGMWLNRNDSAFEPHNVPIARHLGDFLNFIEESRS